MAGIASAMKRGRVILGQSEIDKLKRGESLLVRVKSGMEEIELRLSVLAKDRRYSEGSFESIIESFFK
jgi:hypothetical protein